MRTLGAIIIGVVVAALPCVAASDEAASGAVAFDSDLWTVQGGQVVEHLGRQSLMGSAYLDGVDMVSGAIEVDVALSGRRSYPGIVFRRQSGREFEHVYVRPHRAGLYPDAVQYAPTVNGISSWQFCNGDGYTAAVELPSDEWIRLRLEFAGTQARLYVGESAGPVLHVKELKLGERGGAIGLQGPADGSAHFSNLRYFPDATPEFDPIPAADPTPGVITTWELSQAFQVDAVDLELPASEQGLPEFEWTEVECEPSGLVDVGRHTGRTGPKPDCVFARTTIDAAGVEVMRLELGYSDAISVFLNDELLFTGVSAYRQRDPSFLGIIGYFDAVYLPLVEGENELECIVTESFGGWGLMARDGNAVLLGEGVEQISEAEGLMTPESVVYDSERDMFYVSGFDAYRSSSMIGGQFISRLSGDGEIDDAGWVGGLRMPTGMAIAGGTLYVVERGALVEIDIAEGAIVSRHAIEGAIFPNDVAIDGGGTIYVSDSGDNTIYRRGADGFEIWLSGDEVSGPNALLVDGGRLIFGNGGDSSLKAADLETGEVATIARFRSGNIDGIQALTGGGYLVSHWEGRVYRVLADGTRTRVLDTTVAGDKVADFEYLQDKGIIAVPTFYTDRVVLYQIGK